MSLEFAVYVRPGASRSRIDGTHDGTLAVRVSAPPEGGRANVAVTEVLAGAFGVRPRDVSVVAGRTARRKRVRIDGEEHALGAVLESLLSR